MVISRDRKKILLVKKSSPPVKGINWNLLVIFLSTIMVLIGIPSMVSACFPDSMGECGATIFVICVSAIVFLLGILYSYAASHRYKRILSRYNKLLFFIIFGLLILISLVVLSTGNLAYFLFFIFLECYVCLFGYFLMVTPEIKLQFKIFCNFCLTGIILFYFGGVIISIGKLNPFLFGFIQFGFVCVLLGTVFFGIGYLILSLKKISSIKYSKKHI